MAVDQNSVACVFCESENVKKISAFGTAQLVNQYYCNSCRTVFEYIRWREQESKQTSQ